MKEYKYAGMQHVQAANIPAELRSLNQWVCWKTIPNGNAKPRKVPVNSRTGREASSTDPSTWSTFEVAVGQATTHNLSGIGFVFVSGGEYSGVDLDHCLNELEKPASKLAEKAIRFLPAYWEVSPSGTGVKAIVKGRIEEGA